MAPTRRLACHRTGPSRRRRRGSASCRRRRRRAPSSRCIPQLHRPTRAPPFRRCRAALLRPKVRLPPSRVASISSCRSRGRRSPRGADVLPRRRGRRTLSAVHAGAPAGFCPAERARRTCPARPWTDRAPEVERPRRARPRAVTPRRPPDAGVCRAECSSPTCARVDDDRFGDRLRSQHVRRSVLPHARCRADLPVKSRPTRAPTPTASGGRRAGRAAHGAPARLPARPPARPLPRGRRTRIFTLRLRLALRCPAVVRGARLAAPVDGLR